MGKETPWPVGLEKGLITGLSLVLLWLSGCAAEQPKPSGATVTPEQVRSHADKAFDKLKQEEQQRTVTSPTSP